MTYAFEATGLQKVFLDMNTRIVSIFDTASGTTHSVYRVVTVSRFLASLKNFQTQYAPGLTKQQVVQWLLSAGAEP